MVNGIQRSHSCYQSVFEHIDAARGDWRKGNPRIFKENIDHEERDALKYILENLVRKSLIKLIPLRRQLNDRGNRLDHLHPLSFFLGILTDGVLKDHFHNLKRKNNKAWSEFFSGVANSFKEEKRKNNIHDYQIETFCRRLGKDPHHVRHLVHIENWKDLINYL